MTNKIGPLDPNDPLLILHIPPEVFEVFNDLILKNWNGKQAKVCQKEVAVLVAVKLNITRDIVFDKNFLDIENNYRNAGWTVKYDKPAYDENYEAYFLFTKQNR